VNIKIDPEIFFIFHDIFLFLYNRQIENRILVIRCRCADLGVVPGLLHPVGRLAWLVEHHEGSGLSLISGWLLGCPSTTHGVLGIPLDDRGVLTATGCVLEDGSSSAVSGWLFGRIAAHILEAVGHWLLGLLDLPLTRCPPLVGNLYLRLPCLQ